MEIYIKIIELFVRELHFKKKTLLKTRNDNNHRKFNCEQSLFYSKYQRHKKCFSILFFFNWSYKIHYEHTIFFYTEDMATLLINGLITHQWLTNIWKQMIVKTTYLPQLQLIFASLYYLFLEYVIIKHSFHRNRESFYNVKDQYTMFTHQIL